LLHLDQEDGVNITANSLHPGAIFTNIVSPEVGQTIPKGN